MEFLTTFPHCACCTVKLISRNFLRNVNFSVFHTVIYREFSFSSKLERRTVEVL